MQCSDHLANGLVIFSPSLGLPSCLQRGVTEQLKEDRLRFSKFGPGRHLLARLSLRVADGEEAWAELCHPDAEEASWSSA